MGADVPNVDALASDESSSNDPLHLINRLQEGAAPAEIETALRHFKETIVDLDHIAQETYRDAAVRKLKEIGCTGAAKMVSAAMPKHNAETETQGTPIKLADPPQWLDEVDGVLLSNEIAETIRRFVVISAESVTAIALWIVLTFTFDAFDVLPLLAILSPVKRCGKTRLMSLLSALVLRPLSTSNITPAALFRSIEKFRPTLLADEGDTFLGDRDELRGIINSGHTPETAFVIRTVGDQYEPKIFSTWAPKAIAQIGDLPDTIEDRSIVIGMRRRSSEEKVERWRARRHREFEPLRQRLARWAADNAELLRSADPAVPDELTSDRAVDNWRPLFAIADAIGGEWPSLARNAAIAAAIGEASTESIGVVLLLDMRHLFRQGGERLPTSHVLKALNGADERPWATFASGKPMTPRNLAALLKPFGIRSKQYRFEDGTNGRGYSADDFGDAFKRYLGSSDPLQPLHSNESMTYAKQDPLQDSAGVTLLESHKPNNDNHVTRVMDTEDPLGGSGQSVEKGSDEI